MTLLFNNVLDAMKQEANADVLKKYFEESSFYKSVEELDCAYRTNDSVPKLRNKAVYKRYMANDFGEEDLNEEKIIDIFDTIFYDCPSLAADFKNAYQKSNKSICKERNIPHLMIYCTQDKLLLTVGAFIYIIKDILLKKEKEYKDGRTRQRKLLLLLQEKKFLGKIEKDFGIKTFCKWVQEMDEIFFNNLSTDRADFILIVKRNS